MPDNDIYMNNSKHSKQINLLPQIHQCCSNAKKGGLMVLFNFRFSHMHSKHCSVKNQCTHKQKVHRQHLTWGRGGEGGEEGPVLLFSYMKKPQRYPLKETVTLPFEETPTLPLMKPQRYPLKKAGDGSWKKPSVSSFLQNQGASNTVKPRSTSLFKGTRDLLPEQTCEPLPKEII